MKFQIAVFNKYERMSKWRRKTIDLFLYLSKFSVRWRWKVFCWNVAFHALPKNRREMNSCYLPV